MFKLASYTQRIDELKGRILKATQEMDVSFPPLSENGRKFRIVFVGQYSAGKSSLIQALTGIPNIQIGAGITTDKIHTYEWSGIEVVDTPGIHTEKRPDHDRLTYGEIASADMLVYVVTNELFDSNLAEHFRKLAIEDQKGREMILVVNKMGRTDGNTPEVQAILSEGLKDVLAPYTPEDMHICFVDIENYFKSLEKRSDNPHRADVLLQRSGYSNFVDTLNHFVLNEHQYQYRVTTNLFEMEKFLTNCMSHLASEIDDIGAKTLIEELRQQYFALAEGKAKLEGTLLGKYQEAASHIRRIGDEATELLIEDFDQDILERQLKECAANADEIMRTCERDAEGVLLEQLLQLDQKITEIEDHEPFVEVKFNLSSNKAHHSEGAQKIINAALANSPKVGNAVVKNALNPLAENGLKLVNFSGSKIHELILKGGHLLHYKFKPWQAVKLAKGAAVGGQILNAFGVGANFILQLKQDQDEAKKREELRKNRNSIRGSFYMAADDFLDHGRQLITEGVSPALDISLQDVHNSINTLVSDNKNREALLRKLEVLHAECQKLITEIHVC